MNTTKPEITTPEQCIEAINSIQEIDFPENIRNYILYVSAIFLAENVENFQPKQIEFLLSNKELVNKIKSKEFTKLMQYAINNDKELKYYQSSWFVMNKTTKEILEKYFNVINKHNNEEQLNDFYDRNSKWVLSYYQKKEFSSESLDNIVLKNNPKYIIYNTNFDEQKKLEWLKDNLDKLGDISSIANGEILEKYFDVINKHNNEDQLNKFYEINQKWVLSYYQKKLLTSKILDKLVLKDYPESIIYNTNFDEQEKLEWLRDNFDKLGNINNVANGLSVKFKKSLYKLLINHYIQNQQYFSQTNFASIEEENEVRNFKLLAVKNFRELPVDFYLKFKSQNPELLNEILSKEVGYQSFHDEETFHYKINFLQSLVLAHANDVDYIKIDKDLAFKNIKEIIYFYEKSEVDFFEITLKAKNKHFFSSVIAMYDELPAEKKKICIASEMHTSIEKDQLSPLFYECETQYLSQILSHVTKDGINERLKKEIEIVILSNKLKNEMNNNQVVGKKLKI